MKWLFLAIFPFLLFSCITTHNFSDGKTRILPKEKVSLDSVDILDPIVVSFDYPDIGDYPVVPNHLYRRPDSIRKLLTDLTGEYLKKDIVWYRKIPTCEDEFFNVVEKHVYDLELGGRQRRSFIIDSIGLGKCLELPANKSFLVFMFRLQTKEVGAGNPSIWDEILGSYFLIQRGRITMFRQYRSYNEAQRSYFPRGSLDRANFPHFPQWQMEKVVRALVDDLKKRVVVTAKPELL